MFKIRIASLSIVFLLCCAQVDAQIYTPPFPSEHYSDTDRYDQVYQLQPHNSYDQTSSITDWLNSGFRSLEIDVVDYRDWQDNPRGPWVSHSSSISSANCDGWRITRLTDCLAAVTNWSDDNPNHFPIQILLDMKSTFNFTASWKTHEIQLLDQIIEDNLGTRLFRYSDLLDHLGSSSNYRNTLKTLGWPTIAEMRGKIVVLLTGGSFGNVNGRMESALVAEGIHNQSAFLCPDVDGDDPHEISGKIDSISVSNSQNFFCSNVKAGDHYQIVANRSNQYRQLMHLWSNAGDFTNTSFEASWIATAHGVSTLGWDIHSVGSLPYWSTASDATFPTVGQRRGLPGYMKIKPSYASHLCLEVENNRYKNGSDIVLAYCDSGSNQKFVYTAEGQLRPKGNNKYCVDFESGNAGNRKKLHLWDCDGGNSEKWAINRMGRFSSRDKNYQYCMDVPGSSTSLGKQLQLYRCHTGSNQRFYFERVNDWSQSNF